MCKHKILVILELIVIILPTIGFIFAGSSWAIRLMFRESYPYEPVTVLIITFVIVVCLLSSFSLLILAAYYILNSNFKASVFVKYAFLFSHIGAVIAAIALVTIGIGLFINGEDSVIAGYAAPLSFGAPLLIPYFHCLYLKSNDNSEYGVFVEEES